MLRNLLEDQFHYFAAKLGIKWPLNVSLWHPAPCIQCLPLFPKGSEVKLVLRWTPWRGENLLSIKEKVFGLALTMLSMSDGARPQECVGGPRSHRLDVHWPFSARCPWSPDGWCQRRWARRPRRGRLAAARCRSRLNLQVHTHTHTHTHEQCFQVDYMLFIVTLLTGWGLNVRVSHYRAAPVVTTVIKWW